MPREQYEASWKDYYEILQIHPKAEGEVITVAYRKLAQMYHPDTKNGSESKFKEINEAREVLSDPTRRARYDQVYWARQSNTNTGPDPWTTDTDDAGDADDQEWDAQWEPAASAASEGAYSWEQEPQRPATRFEGGRNILSNLVGKLSPNPDETQRIMPWPSWSWQRLYLMASIPLALLVIIPSAVQAAWPIIGVGIVFLGVAVYAGLATRWMRATRDAPLPARVTGGVCITVSSISYAAIIIGAIVGIVLFILIMVLMGALLKAVLEEVSKK